jgi:hypothetical protein
MGPHRLARFDVVDTAKEIHPRQAVPSFGRSRFSGPSPRSVQVCLSFSGRSVLVTLFSLLTNLARIENERSFLATAARASSRSSQRDTLRINFSLLTRRGSAQYVAVDRAVASLRPKGGCLAPGTPLPAAILEGLATRLQTAATSFTNQVGRYRYYVCRAAKEKGWSGVQDVIVSEAFQAVFGRPRAMRLPIAPTIPIPSIMRIAVDGSGTGETEEDTDNVSKLPPMGA